MTTDPIAGFLAATPWAGASATPLTGDASARRYLRLTGGPEPALVMIAPLATCGPLDPFLKMTGYLREIGLRAPEVFAQDESLGLLLLEDFGDALLAREATEDPARETDLYARATDVLIALHTAAHPTGLPDVPVLGPGELAKMVSPAFIHYAPNFRQGDAVISALEVEFRALPPCQPTLALRDYHAENLIALTGDTCTGATSLGLLDYQDAVATHPAYDLVSLLHDARRHVPKALQEAMVTRFLSGTGLARDAFERGAHLISLQRNLRILGIFARLSQERPGARYLRFQPIVWHHVQESLAAIGNDALRALLADLPAPEVVA